MAKGYLITVGASRVDGVSYGLHDKTLELDSAERDADAIASRARERGLTVLSTLKGADATTANFIAAVDAAAEAAVGDDLVVLHFSGHGTISRARTPHEDQWSEAYGLMNSSICFYDRPLLDDEMPNLYAKFGASTRVLVMIDACNGGGMSDGLRRPPLASQLDPSAPTSAVDGSSTRAARSRPLPSAIERAFLDWSRRGNDAGPVARRYAETFGKLLPFDAAELALVSNLPAYRRALPDGRWPSTISQFNSANYVSEATRHRLQLLPAAHRDAVLSRAFADGLTRRNERGAAERWTLEGPHRDVDVDVLDGALAPRTRGARSAPSPAPLTAPRSAVGPQVQMLSTTAEGFAYASTFTTQFLALEPSYSFSHVRFARDLDANIRAALRLNTPSVERAFSAPEPVAFTLQHPWQVS